MDITKFTDRKTGKLLPVELPEKDHAFIPEELPGNWQFPASLWPLLADAKQALGELNGMAQTLPNPNLLLTPLRAREAITSSRLEGTYATAQELILFDLDQKQPRSSNDQANAWREVSNYNYALYQGFQDLEKLPVCLTVLKSLHKMLLDGVRGSHTQPGAFRSHQVHLGSTRRYIPVPPQHLDECLDKLEKYINSDDPGFDNLVRCFMVHYQLEAIHPFGDGNGRVGRVLLSLMIYKMCKLKMPWLYLSTYFERYKNEYIDYLFQVSANGAWAQWIEFCLRGVISQAKEAVRVCEELRALREQMLDKIKCGSGRAHAIVENLFSHPYTRIGNLSRDLTVTYHTARKDVDFLVKNEILSLVENVHPKTYVSRGIVRIAYGEDAT